MQQYNNTQTKNSKQSIRIKAKLLLHMIVYLYVHYHRLPVAHCEHQSSHFSENYFCFTRVEILLCTVRDYWWVV